MKRSVILFLGVLNIAFLISCTEEEPEIIDDSDNLTYSEGTISIEGVSELEFSALSVTSIDNTSQVGEDGSFKVNQKTNEAEELPLLFISNGEVLFGYFQESDTDSIMDIDDILLFYFSLHPEVAIETPDKDELRRAIAESNKYEDLKTFVTTSLSANQSPFDDDEFMELFRSMGYTIINGLRAKTKSQSTDDDTFQFTHSRGGLISWPKRFPLFAYVGMQITDEKGVVYGTHIFDRARLVLSPNSLKDWLYDYFIKSDAEMKESFQLPADGTYKITISNGVDGVGTVAFEDSIDKRNRFELGADVIATLLPVGLKTFLKDDCKENLTTLFTNQTIEPLRLMSGNKFELGKFLKGLQEDAFGVIAGCMTSKEITYADYIKSITKKLSLVEDLATLSFFIRDYSWSKISTNEIRYFYDGVSYGGLTYTNVSGDYLTNGGIGKKEFSGPMGSEHIYQAMVSEDIFTYGLNRELKSTVIQYTKQGAARELKFEITRSSGDAAVKEDPGKQVFKENEGHYAAYTDADGKLSFSVIMGKEISEMEIKSAFVNSGIVPKKILFENKSFVFEGVWLVRIFIEDDGSGTGSGNFRLKEEMKLVFDANGYCPITLSNTSIGSDSPTWYESSVSYSLYFDDSNSTLTLTNNYWGQSSYYKVNSYDDNVFYNFGGYPEYKYELHRQ